jgi:hypothetical protein
MFNEDIKDVIIIFKGMNQAILENIIVKLDELANLG